MKYIVKPFPEITIKSQSVRLRFTKILIRNIRNIINKYGTVSIIRYWDYIEIRTKDEIQHQKVRSELIRIPGIHHILDIIEVSYISLQDIVESVLAQYQGKIRNKTFCVRVKRRGEHKFTSVEVERYIGALLSKKVQSSRVRLTNPDITINLEIENNRLLLIKDRYEGIGGFPIGTQEDVLSLISGGFDSGVSSYMLIRRGCRVHYCFFNLGGSIHEISVRLVAHYLWSHFGSSHHVRFITVNFEPIVSEILKKVDDGQMGVVLKRMMVRAASRIAERYNIPALVTGEVIGQVSSQTLTNLRLIDSISNSLILRPLISYDKEKIINLSRTVGTGDFSRIIPEYCGIISKRPTVKAIKEKIEAEEDNFDFTILNKVIEESNSLDIRQVIQKTDKKEEIEVETVNYFRVNDVILDIRSVDEQDSHPLKIEGAEVVSLPFYNLNTQFRNLDQSKTWLLWCEHGIMSRLQALFLREKGFLNVKVYRPS